MWKFPFYEVGKKLDWDSMLNAFDWLSEMKSVPQDQEWHAEGDVFTHTKWVVEELLAHAEFQASTEQEKHVLLASALLHDVEKRSTTRIEVIDGRERIVSPRHAKYGEFTSRRLLYTQMDCPFLLREHIAKLVRLHGLPLWGLDRPYPHKEVVASSWVLNNRHLALLSEVDVRGRSCPDKEDLLLKVELFRELCKEADCYGYPRKFASSFTAHHYLQKPENGLDYEAFDTGNFTVTLLCALPGTGKDTYLKNEGLSKVVSLDEIRRAYGIAPSDKFGTGKVVQIAQEEVRVYLRKKQAFVFNATNLSYDLRSKWIGLFKEYGAKVRICYLEVPFSLVLEQNKDREHVVPESVLSSMLDKLELPSTEEAEEVQYIVKDHKSAPSRLLQGPLSAYWQGEALVKV